LATAEQFGALMNQIAPSLGFAPFFSASGGAPWRPGPRGAAVRSDFVERKT
jgi:hypothetical protein